MKLGHGIEILPILHGKELFARQVRRICLEEKYDCIAVDIPAPFQQDLAQAVDNLPFISALIARRENEPWIYMPADPCDPCIEGVRQARQNRIPFHCIGYPELYAPEPLPNLPDEYAIEKLGFEAFASLVLTSASEQFLQGQEDTTALHIASRLHDLRASHQKILALVHVRHFARAVYHFQREESCNKASAQPVFYNILKRLINPDHLYFALGELPFVTAKFEQERHDIFSSPVDMVETVKDLFREIRDNYFEDKDQITQLSPVRIQAALTYLRNMTVMSRRLLPSLFDIVEAAKGVGGNAYALRILKGAKYYPFLPFENSDEFVNIGIDRLTVSTDSFAGREKETHEAINLFRDIDLQWRTLSIKPDPSMLQKKRYRYRWNPFGMCSHVPEDTLIENFNSHVRNKTMRTITEHLARTEKFTSSVKDGIDIRETLRNWHTGSIYVKEIPPVKNKVDTVVILFDENHDEHYPHRTVWYAEHDQESTLTFYSTDPFQNLIGPGIARCTYGGLSLLFPPRPVPNAFEIAEGLDLPNCASTLTYGALMFSREKAVAYVAAKAPGIKLRSLASRFGKHLVWIPLSNFSNETLVKLRKFHVLNGKDVRSWATRFIGE
ncbi:MAG: hypothetical protein ACLFVQ_10465 [Chitinispirillaceae bacterium]